MKHSTLPVKLAFSVGKIFFALIVIALASFPLNGQNTIIIGANNGANLNSATATGYPCPLQDANVASRAQYLYTAAELSAAGYTNGSVITQIGWVTNALTLTTHLSENYTISLKNTGIATLSVAAWETALTAVYGPTNYSYPSATAGNIMFNTTNFVYTGGALVVEVCGGIGAGSASGNPLCQWTTGFTQTMSHTFAAAGVTGCGNASVANIGTTTNRPRLVLSKYCTPITTNACSSMWIENFSTSGAITNISNLGSSCTFPSYGNFYATQNVTQYQGYTVNITVSDNNIYSEGMAIWVDWNQNGSFADAGEAVWNSGSSVMPANFTGSYTVPLGAALGATRMRIRSAYTYVPTDPCTAVTWGEAEDYKFTVVTPPPCSGIPNPGTTISSLPAVCDASTTVSFTIQNTGLGTGITYQWQSSPTGAGYADISGATVSTYTVIPTSSAYYQCAVTCAGNTGISTPLLVQVIPTPVMTLSSMYSTCSDIALNIPLTSNVPSSYTVYAIDNPNISGEPWWGQIGYTSLFDVLSNYSDTSQVVLYTITLTDSVGGCVGTPDTVAITVHSKPRIDSVRSSPSVLCSGGNSTIAVSSTQVIVPAGYCIPLLSYGCGFPDIITNVTFGSLNRSSACDNLSGVNGYSFFPSFNPLIAAGTPTTLTVSTGGDTEGAAVWIDYDQNGVFDASELVLNGYLGTNPATYSNVLTVPFSARTGTTMMRVRGVYNIDPSSLGPCGNSIYGETEDYYITITGGVPSVDYIWSPASFLGSTTGTSVTATGISSSTTYTVSATSGAGCSNSDSTFILVNPLPLVPTVTASPAVICSGNNSVLTATDTLPASAYCTPTTDCSSGDYISLVTFSTINHSTYDCDDTSGYTYMSSPNPTIIAGNSYTLYLETNSYYDNIGVWIDYDQNGIFDASEMVYNDGQTTSYSTTITIPATALNGTTRMRVRSYYMGFIGPINACDNYWDDGGGGGKLSMGGGSRYFATNAGETEDYSIVISGGLNPISYAWSPSTFLSSVSGTSVTAATMTGTTTYTVSAVATVTGCAATGTGSATVTVNPLPVMTSAATLSVCSGNALSLTLTSSVVSGYVWIATDNPNTSGESTTNQNTGTINDVIFNNTSVAQTVTYSVIPTSTTGGCIGNTQTITVTVYPKPSMTSAATATICSGTLVSIPLTSNISSSYHWIATNNPNITGESLGLQSTSTLANTLTNNTAVVQTVSYTVTPTSSVGGCVGNTQNVFVTVNPAPTMTSATTATICNGASVNIPLTSNVVATYTWIAANNPNTTGESTTTQNTSTLTNIITNNTAAAQTVVYSVTPTASTGSCAGTVQTVNVIVNPTPAMTSTATATICSGATVNISLTSNITSTYSWIANDNPNTTGESTSAQSTSALNNTIINNTTSSQTVVYTVTPTSSAGSCTGTSQTITVIVNPSPTMTSIATGTVCSGNTLNIPFASDVTSSYTWIAADNINTAGESLTTQSSATLNNTITNNVASVQSVSYTVTPTSLSGGCAGNTQTVVITVNPAPTMTNASAATICSGNSVNIPLTSTTAATYTWIAANNPNTVGESTSMQVTGTINNTIFNTTTGAQLVSYTATPTSSLGCDGTPQIINVTVNAPPNMTSTASTTICSGSILNIPFASDVASSYSWIANNNPNTTGESLITQSTDTLNDIIVNATASPQTVIYSVTPTSTAGACAGNSQTISVTVNPLPLVSANASATTVCDGAAITLTGSGASAYSWDNGVTDGMSFTINATTTYIVTGTNLNGCSNTATVTINVNPLPLVIASASANSVCSGTSVILTGGGANTYLWNNGVTNGVAFTPSLTSTYIVTGTNSNGCSNTDSITIMVNALPMVTANATTNDICTGTNVILTGGGASTYTWNNGVVDGVSFSPASTSSYIVTGTDSNGCVNTASTTVNVNPSISTSQAVLLCPGGSITIGTHTYSVAGVYTDSLTAFAGCDSVITTNLSISAAISSSQSINICSGSSFVVGSSSYNTSGTYTDVLTAFSGCDSTVTTNLSVNSTISGSQSYAICSGGNISVGTSVYTSSGVYTDTLTANAGCDSVVTTTLIVNPAVTGTQSVTICSGTTFTVGSHSYNITGTYTDTLSTATGCDSIVTTNLTMNSAIFADAGVMQTICNGDTVMLAATASGGIGILTYSWSVGGTGANTTATPSLPIIDSLTVIDSLGCIGRDTVTIFVNPGAEIYGHVTSPTYGDIAFGTVMLFGWQPILVHFDTIQIQGFDATGHYHFTNVPHGKYILETFADPTIYSGIMPTYYDTLSLDTVPTVFWDSAQVLQFVCGGTYSHDIKLMEQVPQTGVGHIGGRLFEGLGYHNLDDPIPGMDIKSGRSPHGSQNSIVQNTTTTPSIPPAAHNGGYYDFRNLDDGCYYIYVDIPGLKKDTLYYICINSGTNDTSFLNRNYYANDTGIYIIDTLGLPLTAPGIATSENNFVVYPNPFSTSATIEYDLNKNSEVKLEIVNILGEKIYTIADANQQSGKYKYALNVQGRKLNAGVYFVTLNVNGDKRTQRIIVME